MQFRIGSDVGREQKALSELFCHGPKFKVDHRSIHCVCVLLFFLSVAHLLLITSCHANNYLTNKDDLLVLQEAVSPGFPMFYLLLSSTTFSH